MFRFGIRSLLVLTTIAAALLGYHHYSKYHKRWRKIEELIAGFDVQQRTARQYGGCPHSQFYRQIFSIAESDLLPWLQEHPNDSIALQSSWEAVERSVPLETNKGTVNPGKEELNEFVRILADRFRAPMPEWWRELILGSRARRRYNIYFFDDKIKTQYHNVEGFNCPRNATLEIGSNGITYNVDRESILLSNSVLKALGFSDDHFGTRNLSGCFSEDGFFVTAHNRGGWPHSIALIDRESLDVIWQSEVHGCSAGIGLFGIHFSRVELVATDSGQLFVFGFATTGLYMESFDLETGESLFHFSTGYGRDDDGIFL
ncbi:MAG: hypothetical protein AAGG48_30535 [Planctomycetota bacterium]